MSSEQVIQYLSAIRATALRQIKQIDGLLAMIEEEPTLPVPAPEGCQHVHTVETPTLGQPGGKLCLDCDQNL